MKRQSNIYEKIIEIDNIKKAILNASKGKKDRKSVDKILCNIEYYTLEIHNMLKNKTYKHGGYTVFYITEPKVRKIEKSRYIDRIVHRWVVDNFLIPYFVPTFINTTYACLKGRGIHKACLDVQKAMLHCKRIWNEYYILKMDIKKYFENINKNILYRILKKKIKDQKLLWLINEIVFSNEGIKNLPIGNYTSQMFANIYLNELDQYIKHKLHCKYYYRYMDDGIILIKTKEQAKEILENIKIFLKENLELELNKKTQIFKSKQGVNFCGYKINEYRLKIRDKGKRKLKKKVKELKYYIKTGELTSKNSKKYLAGHLGYLKIANVNNLNKNIFYSENE